MADKPRRNEPHVPGFQIIGPRGEGAMGVVWEAVQLSTRRRVALKVLSEASLGSQRRKSRFVREIELAASLEHPNIARVYDSGLNSGVYYYAMELINGAAAGSVRLLDTSSAPEDPPTHAEDLPGDAICS